MILRVSFKTPDVLSDAIDRELEDTPDIDPQGNIPDGWYKESIKVACLGFSTESVIHCPALD